MVNLISILIAFLSLFIASCASDNSSDDNSSGNGHSISGYIQKGPFIQNSEVTILELNSDLTQNGNVYIVNTINDYGRFSFNGVTTEFVEIIATGYYYNEYSGSISDNQLTLSAFASTDRKICNVNVLTTLTKDRVKLLMINENMDFEDANHQALKEVLHVFSIDEDLFISPSELNITESEVENGALLAISLILQGSRSTGELSELIAKINSDISEYGYIYNNSDYINREIVNSLTPEFELIDLNLNNRYADLGQVIDLPDYRKFIKSQFINNGQILSPSLDAVNYYFIGDWKGSVTVPPNWLADKYNAQVIFNEDLTYSVKSIDYSPVFYWGSDADSPYKKYSIDGIQADGKAFGTLLLTFPDTISEYDTTRGSLENIYFSNYFNTLNFEFWDHDQHGPVAFSLHRIMKD
jgi:hypothetical protein